MKLGTSQKYMIPVVESRTAYWIYNPNQASALSVTYSGANIVPGSFSVPPGEVARPAVEPFGTSPGPSNIILTSGNDYSGILFEGDDVFYGLVQVLVSSTTGVSLSSPSSNSHHACFLGLAKVAPNWIAQIDADGDGVFERKFMLAALDVLRIDNNAGNKDLSGALIVCFNSVGQPVKIAAAWGLDPSLSFSADSNAIDTGTAVLPLGNECKSSCPKRPEQDPYFEDYGAVLGTPRPLKCCMNKLTPPNGLACAPSEKICLCGQQTCPDGSVHPTTRCDCPGNPNNIWSCVPVGCP